MQHRHNRSVIVAVAFGGLVIAVTGFAYSTSFFPHEEGLKAEDGTRASAQDDDARSLADPFADWRRPDGPTRIALQAGHWKRSEVPDEQDNLRHNNAAGNGFSEWEVNLAIAEAARTLLLEADPSYVVDILPTTVPQEYHADVFVSIHADSNPNKATRGYKAASPRRDRTGDADRLAAVLVREYAEVTGLPRDPNLTSGMRGYYAFNWCKYDHSLHPMTVGALLETGFLTNAGDVSVIGRDAALAARGIVNGIVAYLEGAQASAEEILAVTTVPEWVREAERKRDAERRADERARGIVNPSDLIASNANRPDDPWCQPMQRTGSLAE